MATHGEIRWPSVGTFDGRLRGDSHGRRQEVKLLRRASHPMLAVKRAPKSTDPSATAICSICVSDGVGTVHVVTCLAILLTHTICEVATTGTTSSARSAD